MNGQKTLSGHHGIKKFLKKIWLLWENGGVITISKTVYTLTLDGDPWMMGDLAHPDPTHWGVATFDDWDIYPRPSTDFVGNTVGVVLDPMAVHNYCIDDGNPECTQEELNKIEVAYKFVSFWAGDTRAWKARAEQMFQDGLLLKTALNDSLPLVTGDDFDAQMEIGIQLKLTNVSAIRIKCQDGKSLTNLGRVWSNLGHLR